VDNLRRFLQGEAQERFAELPTGFEVHLVVDQPHCDLGDTSRPFFDLDPVHLVNVHANGSSHIDKCVLTGVFALDYLVFDTPKFSISDYEEVSASTCRIEKLECG
jgi:hypothetical protein